MLKVRTICRNQNKTNWLISAFGLLNLQDPDSEAGSTETEVSKVSLMSSQQ